MVAFRVSPEEDEQLEKYVALSGLTKQEYITSRLLEQEIVVQGSPRVYKALRNQLAEVLKELKENTMNGVEPSKDTMDLIRLMTSVLEGMSHER